MNLVYIYGPPGVGKFTVGKTLAKMTGYKLFHNQLSIEFVRSIFNFGSEPFNRFVLEFRREMIEEAARRNIPMIFTSLYAKGYSEKLIKEIVRRVEKNKGHVYFVQLQCDMPVLLKRIHSKSRSSYYKIRSAKKLARLLHRYDLSSELPFGKSLFIDNTHMSPQTAARMIIEHYKLKSKP